MSQSTFTVRIEIGGAPQAGLSVVASDPTGAYGVKRTDTDAVVVADATVMSEVGGGYYALAFTDPAPDLAYTGWVEYVYDGETYHVSNTFDGTASVAAAAPRARRWESILCYENRSDLHTSRWRLSGLSTRRTAPNTDNGVLWLKTTVIDGSLTAELYKHPACAAGDKVASGAADISGVDGTAAGAVEVELAGANDSGLSGAFWIHRCAADSIAPLQAALCTDEDLAALWEGIDDLPGYNAAEGMAEFIRIAGDDVLGRVSRMFSEHFGGRGAPEAWFITDASRTVPDLRRIANPSQLRLACAYRALEIALGRHHQRAADTMYSRQRDLFAAEFARIMESLTLTLTSGATAAASADVGGGAHRLARG